MKVTLVISLLFVSHFVASSQSSRFKYTVVKEDEFSFPVFKTGANDSLTVQRINRFLQLAELDLLVEIHKRSIFSEVSIDLGTIYGGKTEMRFSVLSNNSRYLSIVFDEASCGATCAYWNRYYNFNPGNGDLMQLEDFFTPQGFVLFKKMVLKKRTTRFEIEALQIDTPYRENVLQYANYFASDDLHDYFIEGDTLYIDGNNILGKNEKFMGLDMLTPFRLKEFSKYLNEYGKAVWGLSASPVAEFRSYKLPQLFEGNVADTIPILMIINNDYDNEMRGIYAYLKYGTGIFFDGKLYDNQLELTEYIGDFEENAYIEATFNGREINGTWTDLKKTKTLTLRATQNK